MELSSLTPDRQIKFQYWLDIIRQCRASGLTNQAWCEQNSVSLKSYYYWLAKIRKLAVAELPRKDNGIRCIAASSSVPLQDPAPEFTKVSLPNRHVSRPAPAAVLHIGTMTVELFEDTPCELLTTILKAVQLC